MKIKSNNKFYSIYNTLSDSERLEFCEYLKLSFIKKPRLSEIIIEMIESGNELMSFLEKKYSERSLYNIYSELKKSLKEYLAVKEITQTENESKINKFAGKQLKKRGLYNLVLSDLHSELKKKLKSDYSSGYFAEVQDISYEYAKSLSDKGIQKEIFEIDKMNADFMLMAFVINASTSQIERGISKEFNGDKTISILDGIQELVDFPEILKRIEEKYPEHFYIFQIAVNLYASIKDTENLEAFLFAWKIFLKNRSRFSEKTLIEYFYTFLNVCTYISHRAEKPYDREMFEIMKAKLESGLTEDLSNSKLGGNHFRDYVYIALKLDEDKWAESFIEKYSSILPNELKENSINSAMAFLNLNRKNYKEAIELITRLDKKLLIHDLDFYTVQIFANYEMGNIVECLRIKKRFSEYLKSSSRIPKPYVKGCKNFLKLLSKLLIYKETGKKSLLDELEYDIANRDEFFWRKWICDKINEAVRLSRKDSK